MLGLIERLNHVRAIGIDAARGHRVHQARLAQLAREAGRTTAQHIAGYERQRRHATLVAITLELGATLTDQAIDLFERLVGTMFSKAETRHARAFQADGRAINEKVRLYARVGAALIAAREAGRDPFEAITTVIPWERFRASVAEAEALARPEDFDSYEDAGRALRRGAPLGAGVSRRLLLSGRSRRRLAAARRRRAARHERGRGTQAAEIRPDRLHPRAMVPVCDARRRARPALLRALRAVGAAGPVARRRRLGRRQPPLPVLRRAPDLARGTPASCCRAAPCRSRSIPISSVLSPAAAPFSMRVWRRSTPRRRAACCPMSRSRRGC